MRPESESAGHLDEELGEGRRHIASDNLSASTWSERRGGEEKKQREMEERDEDTKVREESVERAADRRRNGKTRVVYIDPQRLDRDTERASRESQTPRYAGVTEITRRH